MSIFFNVVTRKDIPHSEGKTVHHKVGTIKVTPNGGWFLHLFMLPDVDFQIFPSHEHELPVIEFSDHD